MNSELLSAGAALAGVALGIVGTLMAARIQAKGSHAQAEATYRAAVTTAQTQYAATLEQQNRAAQRAAYVAFIAAFNAFQRAMVPAEARAGRDVPEPLLEPLDRLHAAITAVELEGPPEVLAAARSVTQRAVELADMLYELGEILESWRALVAGRHVDEARNAHTAVLRVHEVARAIPMTHRSLHDADRQVRAERMGEYGEAWLAACESAESALAAAVAVGALTEDQAADLLWDVSSKDEGTPQTAREHRESFTNAAASFIEAARHYLNDTQPRTT
ncbi:hypothetical protein [Streptomyces platensis]|uniref:hypothetical protein n=1 Tax=Streptomyces platensis TaxID=58346 RepID=UPI001F4210AA|nr:hypothetical protein [Streptomyces platensis]MCF3142207.1 hypothetical protein [Streptomyces platensis]